MGGVFGELALEDVLFLFGVVQLYVELGDAVCYLTELVVGELGKVVFVEGGSVSCEGGEGAQFGYVAAELMGEAVEDDAEEDGYREGEPGSG